MYITKTCSIIVNNQIVILLINSAFTQASKVTIIRWLLLITKGAAMHIYSKITDLTKQIIIP